MFSLESENFRHSRLKGEMAEFRVLFACSSCATKEAKHLPVFVITMWLPSQKGLFVTQATPRSFTFVLLVHTKLSLVIAHKDGQV